MINLKITEITRSAVNDMTVKIEPSDTDTSGNVFIEKMPLETSGMIIGKKYYLLSEDDYTPPEVPAV